MLTGADWSLLDTHVLWAYEGTVPESGRNRRHRRPPFYSAWLLLDGEVTVTTKAGVVRAGVDSWIIPAVNEPRTQLFAEGSRILSVTFTARWRNGLLLFERFRTLSARSIEWPGLEPAARHLISTIDRTMDSPQGLVAETSMPFETYGHIHEKFAVWFREWYSTMIAGGALPRGRPLVDSRVQTAMAILGEATGSSCVPYGRIHREAGISRTHLDRLFRKEIGLTPKQYQDDICESRAIELLHSTSLSVKEIAYRTGFPGPPQFCRWFKRKTGTRPSRFRIDAH
jgi:AraC-like DNA-binding protein